MDFELVYAGVLHGYRLRLYRGVPLLLLGENGGFYYGDEIASGYHAAALRALRRRHNLQRRAESDFEIAVVNLAVFFEVCVAVKAVIDRHAVGDDDFHVLRLAVRSELRHDNRRVDLESERQRAVSLRGGKDDGAVLLHGASPRVGARIEQGEARLGGDSYLVVLVHKIVKAGFVGALYIREAAVIRGEAYFISAVLNLFLLGFLDVFRAVLSLGGIFVALGRIARLVGG